MGNANISITARFKPKISSLELWSTGEEGIKNSLWNIPLLITGEVLLQEETMQVTSLSLNMLITDLLIYKLMALAGTFLIHEMLFVEWLWFGIDFSKQICDLWIYEAWLSGELHVSITHLWGMKLRCFLTYIHPNIFVI